MLSPCRASELVPHLFSCSQWPNLMPSSASRRLFLKFEIVAMAFSPFCWQCHDPPSSYTNLRRQVPRSYFSPEHLAPLSLFLQGKFPRGLSSWCSISVPPFCAHCCRDPEFCAVDHAMPDLLNYLPHSFCSKSNESHNWGCIPDICQGRHKHTRVKIFWSV